VHSFQRPVITLAGLAALAAAVALMAPRQGYSQEKAATQVQVVNTTAAPVPATIVNPASAPVKSQIVNTSAAPVLSRVVNIVPVNGTVTVGNNAVTPLNVRDIGLVSPRFFGQFAISYSSGANGISNVITVPAGKRLILEYVSANANLGDNHSLLALRLNLNNASDQLIGAHWLPTPPAIHSPVFGDSVSISQPLRLEIDPGTKLSFQALQSDGGPGSVSLFATGFLINAP
jgi:hypothetical protein